MASSSSSTEAKYPYPSDVNITESVKVKLSSINNYVEWKDQMASLIEKKGLLGFIKGTVQKPPSRKTVPYGTTGKQVYNPDYYAWRKSDKLLRNWISDTLEPDVKALVKDLKTAEEMWRELEKALAKSSHPDVASVLDKYPYPSEVKITKYVNVKLSTNNYYAWKADMGCLINSLGLLGFIDGEVPMPPERIMVAPNRSSTNKTKEVENPDYQAWLRSDELLRSWILKTLEQDAIELVEHLKTTREMWSTLEEALINYSHPDIGFGSREEKKDLTPYLPLYKAAIAGDWKSTEEIFKKTPDAVKASITGASETALIVAAWSAQAKAKQFVNKLIKLMKPEDLAQTDRFGNTALHAAARIGNIEAAEQLVLKNRNLPHLFDTSKSLPLHHAAELGRKEMVTYLLGVTNEEVVPKLFEGTCGDKLVHHLIRSGLYDIALKLVQKHPTLAIGRRPLQLISNERSAFLSGTPLNFWERLIYKYVPLELEDFAHHQSGGDIENTTQSLISAATCVCYCYGDRVVLHTKTRVWQKLYTGFWKVLEIIAPHIKNIRDKKVIHHQARELVKHLCKEIARLNYLEAPTIFEASLKFATCGGIHEVVEEILDSSPSAGYITNKLGQTVFHLAVKHRWEKVFNLIYQFREDLRYDFFTFKDINLDTCLHLAGNLENEQKLSLRASAAGAALQMQRELHWFKEVEKHAVSAKGSMNINGKTPTMLFTETHKDLVKEGEQWMKDTANSCTIVAALIVTIVFAAAITVPGGNNGESGLPIFSKQIAFKIFAISDALALFSSTSSLLMFLSILTARYGEYDFLYALPKRLIIGSVTLFISMISMMMAFGAILFLVFEHKKPWILIPVAVFSCIPIGLFASLQFPLLLDTIKSTYGPSIFGKQRDHLLV